MQFLGMAQLWKIQRVLLQEGKIFLSLHVCLNWDDPIRFFRGLLTHWIREKTSDPELRVRFEDVEFSPSLVSLSFSRFFRLTSHQRIQRSWSLGFVTAGGSLGTKTGFRALLHSEFEMQENGTEKRM